MEPMPVSDRKNVVTDDDLPKVVVQAERIPLCLYTESE